MLCHVIFIEEIPCSLEIQCYINANNVTLTHTHLVLMCGLMLGLTGFGLKAGHVLLTSKILNACLQLFLHPTDSILYNKPPVHKLSVFLDTETLYQLIMNKQHLHINLVTFTLSMSLNCYIVNSCDSSWCYRKPTCDIRIQLPQVSKEHCRIDFNENKEVKQRILHMHILICQCFILTG